MEAEGQNTLPTEPVLRVEEKKLVVTFIQFLRQKVSANECTEAQIEGLEVAVQCLENAFGLTDKNYAFQPGKSLLQIFTEAEGVETGEEEFPTPTQQDIDRANSLKEEGNDLVKTAKFQEAIEKYNQAIKLNRDPVYFCNRAAAYCRLEQYDLAIQDCRTAIALDENYAKAYGRLGLALSCQNRYDAAIEAYTKALELDPNNESYKSNKTIAEEKVREAQQRFQANPGMNPFGAGLGSMFGGGAGAGPGGMPDLGSMLNNPQMMQAAMQMMNDPNMQNLMSGMMESFMGGSGGAGGGNMADLLAAGQSMAQQMQNANPELVEQLRRQFAGSSTSDNPDQNQQGNNPPNNPPPQ